MTGRFSDEARQLASGREAAGARRRPAAGRRSVDHTQRRQRRRRRLLIGLGVLAVLIGTSAAYLSYLTQGLKRVNVSGLRNAFTTGQEVGTENILMAGSTSRCALAVQNPAYGLCSQGVNGVNGDVIMVLHVDSTHHRLALLSIPRDLFVLNARSTGADKVDAALFQGLTQLVATVQDDFGIPIQHAVSLNFDQFTNVVDALGGIKMSFPMSVFDAYSGLNVAAATCVQLNGTQALQVVRARRLQYDGPGTSTSNAKDWPQEAQSDLARIRRDHEFLRVLATSVATKGLGDPITDTNIINSVKDDISFDQSWSVTNMAALPLDFHSVDVNSVPQLTLPIAVVTDPEGSGGGLMYEGSNYGDAEFPSQPQDRAAIDQVLGIGPTTDSMTGDPLPVPSSVTVSVMNGTGGYNQAADTAAALAAIGFHTTGTGDTPSVGDVAQTVVYYGSHSPATEAAAEAVAGSMTGSVTMAYDPSRVSSGAEVTVVTGTQFAVNAPPAANGPVGGSTAPATSEPTTTQAAAPIAAPSPPTSGLQPWDPRACPAGVTATAPVPNHT